MANLFPSENLGTVPSAASPNPISIGRQVFGAVPEGLLGVSAGGLLTSYTSIASFITISNLIIPTSGTIADGDTTNQAFSKTQTQLNNKQGLNTNLTQLSGITSQGLIYRGVNGVGTGDITGTTNQVIVANSDGTYNLSLPQGIATNSDVQFAIANLSGLNVSAPTVRFGSLGNSGRVIFIRGSDGTDSSAGIGYVSGTANAEVRMYSSGTGGNLTFHAGASQRMAINNNGNVGIGISNPQSLLDVNGNILSTSDQTTQSGIGTASSATSRLTVLGSSTASEFGARFFVPASATPVFAIQNNNTITSNGTFIAQNTSSTNTVVVARVESGVGTNLAVRADGSVLIGAISTPAARLQVRTAGDLQNSFGIRVENTSGTEVWNVNSFGWQRPGGGGTPNSYFHVTAGASANAWTTNGILFRIAAQTFTDQSTADGATVTNQHISSFLAPTLTASLGTSTGVTYTTSAAMAVTAPIAGSNTTIRNPYAFYSLGNSRVDGVLFCGDNSNYATAFGTSMVSTTTHRGVQIRAGAQNVPTVEFYNSHISANNGDVGMDLACYAGTSTIRRIARIRATFNGTSENAADLTFSTMTGGVESDRMQITHDGIVRVGSAATNAPFLVNATGAWGFTTAVAPNTGWSASSFTTLKTLTGAATTGDVANALCTLINTLIQHGVIRA